MNRTRQLSGIFARCPFGLERGKEALHRGIVRDVAERLIEQTTPLSGINRRNRSHAQLLALTVKLRTLNA